MSVQQIAEKKFWQKAEIIYFPGRKQCSSLNGGWTPVWPVHLGFVKLKKNPLVDNLYYDDITQHGDFAGSK